MTESSISRRAFTLVELMVSIFLLLLVMIGVNTVFSTTSATIGAGQAQSSLTRDARAAFAVMSQDFANSTIVNSTDSPFIIISNMRVNAFQNRQDYLGDPTNTGTGVDTWDPNGDGVIDTVNPAVYDERSHRIDTLQYFARGQYPRQTGGIFGTAHDHMDQPFAAPQTGTEAWIVYGHLRLPRNDGLFWANPPTNTIRPDPGLGTAEGNQNNFFASQWVLGRNAIVLADKDLDTPETGNSAGKIYDKFNKSQIYINRNWTDGEAGSTSHYGPFNYGSGSNPTGVSIEESRIDLAATSISKARVRLAKILAEGGGATWWSDIAGSTNGQRFQSNPFVMRPLTAATISAQTPVFLKGCTQFIVEFAGDYTIQNWNPDGDLTPNTSADVAHASYGAITGAGQDGQIDTIVLGAAGPTRRQVIRWYGMPRNVDTSDDGSGVMIAGSAASIDVVPVRDIVAAPQSFERAPLLAQKSNYADNSGASTGLQKGDIYRCAWGPNDANRPKMIRVVFTIVDSENRIPAGQTYEYVFNCN